MSYFEFALTEAKSSKTNRILPSGRPSGGLKMTERAVPQPWVTPQQPPPQHQQQHPMPVQQQPQPHQQPHPQSHPPPQTQPSYQPAVKADVISLQQTHTNQSPPQPSPQVHQPPPPPPSHQARDASNPAGNAPQPAAHRPMATSPPVQASAGPGAPGQTNGNAVPFRGFRSPRLSALKQGVQPLFDTEVAELKRVISAHRPAVVRQAVRDLFETTLAGSDYHSSFVCHSVFHKTAPPIFASAVKSLGENYVKSSLDEIFTHVDTEALDRVAPQVFSKASASFMDQALESRLDTISGRQLVNALAKAERLGYSAEDIVVESSGASKSERVIPAIKDISSSLVAAQPQAAPSPQPAQAPTMAWPVSPEICGDYSPEHTGAVEALLKTPRPAPMPSKLLPASHKPALQNHDVQRLKTPGGASSPAPGSRPTASASPAQAQGYSSPGNGNSDPYAKLTPEQRQAFEADMRRAEDHYGQLLAAANKIENEEEKTTEMNRIKNTYATKQSLTRKKYGIRLRERRTKAEVEEERQRIMDKTENANKRARADSGTPNVPAKRIMISEMGGGLSGSAGTAELHDPTANAPSQAIPQPQWQPRPVQTTGTPGSGECPMATTVAPNTGASWDPMQVVDSSGEDTDTSDDIPA
ncbi:hypothetical protein K4F52_005934 [Lecanicillium sp. MT-2017a]|nr:hypothetical protein K4F52_005934 [Lecanicillium sp. MT-2017a]